MYKNTIVYILFFLTLPFALSSNNIAEIRAIDRSTGRTYKLEVPLNKEIIFSNLILNVEYCYKNPIDKEIENYAYLTVKDKLINKYVFQGWMFSSSPSLSSLEHPINDIWLLNCSNK